MMALNKQNHECFYLMGDGPDVLQRKRLKLVLLQEVIEVLLQHLEHEACMVLVREALVCSHKVELVGIFLAAKNIYIFNGTLFEITFQMIKVITRNTQKCKIL